ncbi:MAG TPA: amidohydrolase family protein [Bryobacteraceae bacterium]|jgi:imidazolonepropionase-like amidohydrolase/ABC-type multidrug transport system permease subunit
MNGYISQIRMTLRLSMRDRAVIFFNYIFPLIFFFLFGQMFHGQEGGITEVVSIVLTIGTLGTGLMGAGIRAAMDREQNILRRFKVAPITAAPILVSSLAAGLVQYLPQVAIVLLLARVVYKMPALEHPASLFLFLSIGVLAFRAIGGIIASVVNSMQESQIVVQLLYMPMFMMAVIPFTVMPDWLQVVAQFIPSTHLNTGMQAILLEHGTFLDNLPAVGTLTLTAVVGTFLGIKLFRWEKEEKVRPAAKLWLLAVLTPFLVMGVWQAHAKDNIARQKILARDLSRKGTWLIHDARLFLGDGRVIERGSVLVKDGKIAQVFEGASPDAKALDAQPIEGAGKTLLPGLIDVHVHLGANGGISAAAYSKFSPSDLERELAAYLFSGVTAVKSVGDQLDSVLKLRAKTGSGEKLGAELFLVGPLFTTEGGHGTEIMRYMPDALRPAAEAQFLRLPKSADEARSQVLDLRNRKVDGIKAVLESGAGNLHFNRMDAQIVKSIGAAARDAGLPMVVHTGESRDIADALDAGASGIEHGSFYQEIPEALFARMKQQGVTYDPTLAVLDSVGALERGSIAPIEGSLVQQVAPPELLASIKTAMSSPEIQSRRALDAGIPYRLEIAEKNLLAAYRAGVTLVTGTDSGNPLTLHGPAVHREMQLWVKAGIPPAETLQAATYNAARLLGVDNRIGLIRAGYEANLLMVEGNPLQDISATERISLIMFKGENRIRSQLELFGKEK